MLARVSDAYDKLVGGFFYDLLHPVAEEIAQIDADNLAMLDRGMLDTAMGEDLDRKAGELPLMRKAGNYATAILRFSGADGTLIPMGTVAASEAAEYVTTEDGTISGGYADIPAACTILGRAGNAAAEAINQTTLTGITVTNPNPVIDGTDPETDEELRERCYFELQHPPGSGNPYDYVR